MAIKTSYTEAEVAQYMETLLGDTARKESWNAADGDFDEAVNQVLYNLEQNDFTFVSSAIAAAEVRAVSAVEAWRMAMYNTAHYASHSVGAPGTGQTSKADVHRFCKDMFEQAMEELERRFPASTALWTEQTRDVSYWTVVYSQDYEA